MPVQTRPTFPESVTNSVAADISAARISAARAALEHFVHADMKIGLGSGTTSTLFVRFLGARVRAGLSVVATPTSEQTRQVAQQEGIRLESLDVLGTLDIALDGADEVDSNLCIVKGGGGCLLREKIVAHAALQFVVMIDFGKQVQRLGAFPLPVEIVPFAWEVTIRRISSCLGAAGYVGGRTELRGGAQQPFITDNGNYIVDLSLGAIRHADALHASLLSIPGVIETGLFLQEADCVVVGRRQGSPSMVFRSRQTPARR